MYLPARDQLAWSADRSVRRYPQRSAAYRFPFLASLLSSSRAWEVAVQCAVEWSTPGQVDTTDQKTACYTCQRCSAELQWLTEAVSTRRTRKATSLSSQKAFCTVQPSDIVIRACILHARPQVFLFQFRMPQFAIRTVRGKFSNQLVL